MARRAVPKLKADFDVEVDSVPRSPARLSDRLRYEAKAVYLTHPDGVTVEELSQDARFVDVSIETMRGWCKEDGWVAGRKKVLAQFGEKLRGDLQRRLYSRIAQVRIDQMETVQDLKNDLLRKILGGPDQEAAKVKSAEGAAKVMVDLMRYEHDLAIGVAQELVPQGGGGTIEPRSSVTDEEVLEAARLVLVKRRQAMTGQTPRQLAPPSGAVVDVEAVEVDSEAQSDD